MKSIISTTLILCLAMLAFGQNYQTLHQDKIGYYDANGNTLVNSLPLLISNTTANSNGDTTHHLQEAYIGATNNNLTTSYYSYYTYCSEVVDTGYFGIQHILKADGQELYFNQSGDTILLRPQAIVGENWIMYKDTLQVVATVDSVRYVSFLNTTDSIKYISLAVQDTNGIAIIHPFNTRQIALSQQYGIYATPSLVDFPQVTVDLQLIGHTNITDGLHNITIQDIYNFEVGDTFQYKETYMENSGYFTYEYERYKQHIILSKNQTSVSVVYQVDVKSVHIELGDTTYSSMIEPKSYIFGTGGLSTEPFVTYDNNYKYNSLKISNFNNKIQKRPHRGFSLDGGTCWTPTVGYPLIRNYYVEGLGNTYSSYYEGQYISIDEVEQLTYYNKAGEIWGVPFDSNFLIPPVATTPIKTGILKVYPNPATTTVRVELPNDMPSNQGITATVYNQLGQEIHTPIQYHTQLLELNVAHLSKGIYSIVIAKDGVTQYHERFLK